MKLLFLFLSIVFIIITYILYNNKREAFTSDNCRNFENENIISEKNLFYDVKNLASKSVKSINCNRLCIKESDGNIECITKEELFNAINMPDFRRHSICIDDACLNKNAINKLNGCDSVKFKSAFKSNETYNKKCMGYAIKDAHTCVRKRPKWQDSETWGTDCRDLPWYSCGSSYKDGNSYYMPHDWEDCSCIRERYRGKRGWVKFTQPSDEWYTTEDYDEIPLHTLKPMSCNEKETKFRILEGLPMSVINKWQIDKIEFKLDDELPQQHMIHAKRP